MSLALERREVVSGDVGGVEDKRARTELRSLSVVIFGEVGGDKRLF